MMSNRQCQWQYSACCDRKTSAVRAMRRCWCLVTEKDAGPKRLVALYFTSMKTSVSPSSATRSISPNRLLTLEAMVVISRVRRNCAAQISQRCPIIRMIWPLLHIEVCRLLNGARLTSSNNRRFQSSADIACFINTKVPSCTK